LQLKELNVIYINNPLAFNADVDSLLESLFNDYFDITTFEDSIRIFKDEFIDLLLIDIDYTEANGLKFLQVIKQKVPDFPVLVFSRFDRKDVLDKLHDIKTDGIIKTPYEAHELEDKIRQISDKIIEFAENREDRKKEAEGKALSVDEAIDHFFKRFNDELRKNNYGRNAKKLNFAIMKTFLYTAYNNFNDFDSKFDDQQLKLTKRNLEKAIKLKRDLERKIGSSLEDNYELIFLNQQAEYIHLKNEFEEAKRKIQKYRDSLGLLTRQIEESKEKVKMLKPSPERNDVEKILKEANKKHVDRVHQIAELKNLIDALDEKIDAYKARHFDEFKTTFLKKTDTIKADMEESLDYAAFAFDKEIWRRAKQSRPVRDFFTESKIEGLFSSKTYLEYCSGNIDGGITSEQNKKILKYLKELNKTNRIEVALIGTITEDINHHKQIIQKIDPMIHVTGFLDPEKAIRQHKTSDFALVVVNEMVGKETGLSIIQKFKEIYQEDILHTEFCINSPSKKRSKLYEDASRAGVRYFIYQDMNSGEIAKKMMEIL